MMGFDKVEITIGTVVFMLGLVLVCGIAGFIGMAAWHASERHDAYRAYTDCLREMREQPIDVKQTFCGKIRDQL